MKDYRRDVDGLRAIAILAVVAYHADDALLPGGFTGVDIFFLISGYLISGLILRDLQKQRFSFAEFYARRVRRIFPALIVMLLALWTYSWLMLFPHEFQSLGKQVLSGAMFYSNLTLLKDPSYFDVDQNPLLHLWSLAVEEQFYIVWPVVLVAIRKFPRQQLRIILFIAIASFVVNVVTIRISQNAAFYLPVSRMWELATGAALAHVQMHRSRSPGSDITRHLLLTILSPDRRAILGVLILAVSFTLIDSEVAFPGWWAVIPVLGSFLLVSAGPNARINSIVLGNRVVVYIGLISYPLYLWHWPLLSLQRMFGSDAVPTLPLIGVAFGLAALTYHFVETPVRARPALHQMTFALSAAMGVAGVLGFLGFHKLVVPRSAAMATVSQTLPRRADYDLLAGAEIQEGQRADELTATYGYGARRALFIGDSVMAHYFPRAAKVLSTYPEATRAVMFVIKYGCPPVLVHDPDESCLAHTRALARYAQDPTVDVVVIGASWKTYFEPGSGDHFQDSDQIPPENFGPNTRAAFQSVESLISTFSQSGKHVILIGQLPYGHPVNPFAMLQRSFLTFEITRQVQHWNKNELVSSVDAITSQLRNIAATTGARLIDPLEFMCDGDVCTSTDSRGVPIFSDDLHLRAPYVREHVTYLDEILLLPAEDGNNA